MVAKVMAKLKISPDIVENMIFGFSENPIYVKRISFDKDKDDYLVFELEGIDIPDCEEITCEMKVQQNRVGQRFISMKFINSKVN